MIKLWFINNLNYFTGQPRGLPTLSWTDRARWRLLTQVLAVSPVHPVQVPVGVVQTSDVCSAQLRV